MQIYFQKQRTEKVRRKSWWFFLIGLRSLPTCQRRRMCGIWEWKGEEEWDDIQGRGRHTRAAAFTTLLINAGAERRDTRHAARKVSATWCSFQPLHPPIIPLATSTPALSSQPDLEDGTHAERVLHWHCEPLNRLWSATQLKSPPYIVRNIKTVMRRQRLQPTEECSRRDEWN